MRYFLFLFFALNAFWSVSQNQKPLHETTKTLLVAHPTTTNIEVLATLHAKELLDLSHIRIIGIYHQQETYDYKQSKSSIDTLTGFHMELLELKDSLYLDSLFDHNRLSNTFKNLFQESIGIVFFGGPDIPPAIYNESPHERTRVTDTYRHYFETSFMFHLLGGFQNKRHKAFLEENKNYFILGICLGMQSLNVATGGTLIQDIPLEMYNSNESIDLSHLEQDEVHRNYHNQTTGKNLAGSWFHKIQFKDNYFADFFDLNTGYTPLVNSYHHQAIEKLGKGLKVGATSLDHKIIEAVYHKDYPMVFGVQFHPERAQLYLGDQLYQFEPEGPNKTMNHWIDQQSMQYHIDFWKTISTVINDALK